MKIGISLDDSLKEFLEETAKLNDLTITRVCSLIVFNFLSFNKERQRIPHFFQFVRVGYVFKDAKKEDGSDVIEKSQVHDVPADPEEKVDWDQIIADLESY